VVEKLRGSLAYIGVYAEQRRVLLRRWDSTIATSRGV
jgi:hypothetical protein